MATKVSDALLSTVNTGFATEKATADQKKAQGSELGQDAFLTMMLTQMKNQDPTKPMDSAQYLAQLAQFSTVSGIEKLNTTIEGFIGQLQTSGAMQASGLVGRQVVVDSDTGYLDATQGLAGNITIDSPVDAVKISIATPGGQVVREVTLGAQGAGETAFHWDGRDASGVLRTPGNYRVVAQGLRAGEPVGLSTSMSAPVDSVSLSAQGSKLNLRGLGEYALDDVRAIF